MSSGRNGIGESLHGCISLGDWDMSSGRNGTSPAAPVSASLGDWDMSSGRNTTALPFMVHISLGDWDMSSGRNRGAPMPAAWFKSRRLGYELWPELAGRRGDQVGQSRRLGYELWPELGWQPGPAQCIASLALHWPWLPAPRSARRCSRWTPRTRLAHSIP